jgi:hypothetical protein
MTISIFLEKLKYKVLHYWEKFILRLALLPKKYLASLVINIFALSHKSSTGKKRAKPQLLILRNNTYANKSNQLSTEVFHLDNTLKSSGLASFDILTYEELHLSPLSDFQLIKKCQELRPDAVILSSWWHTLKNHPSEHAIQFIRKKLNIPVVSIWWDTCSTSFGEALRPLMEVFDVHVVIDNPNMFCLDKNSTYGDRFINLWPPQDAGLFHSQTGTRDVPVAFLGQISAYRSYRGEVLNHLLQNNIPGKFLTQNREAQVSHAEYANFMRNSKISLNFSQSVDCNQLKSRVFEIIFSGALLMESENEQTSKMFTPMKDYVSFQSKEDLAEKIRYYLNHEDELTQIAEQGLKTAFEKYNSNRFWELLLKKLKLI